MWILMVADFDIKCYFTPYVSGGSLDWYRPYQLAHTLLSGGSNTTPGVHQYVTGTTHDTFALGLRAPVESIQLTKTLDQGSWAHIEMVTHSDRDIFEMVNNQVSSSYYMMPRMKYPYRSWEIDLKDNNDSDWHTPALFRGMLTEVAIQTLSDVAIANQQDGVWRVSLDFESFDAFCLHKDLGAPLWYHRATPTTNSYHWAFTPQDNITFAGMITQVIAWMNQGRPTQDFPITYSFASGSAPYNAAPYTYSIFDPIGLPILNTATPAVADSITFTNGSTAVEGSADSDFTSLKVGMLIAPNANIAGEDSGTPATYRLNPSNWGQIASITDFNTLVLTANYGGTTSTGDKAASWNGNTTPVVTCKDTSTWDILRQILRYMGVVEGSGLTYIPQLSTTGAVTVTRGGYNKAASVDEDFRSTQGMQKNTSTDMTIQFNMVSVPFFVSGVPGNNDNEYWIKFTLYRANGGGWDTVLTIPSTGYEYVAGPTPATWKEKTVPAHGRKYYKFPTQSITTENTYKWDVDLVTAGSFTIGTTGGSAYSPASYNFLNSPSKIKYGDLKTFMTTMGKCSQVGIYNAATARAGCHDGADGFCPDRQGCYPDPSATPAEVVNFKYGILGQPGDYAYTSNEDDHDTTMCRQHSQTLYECFLNTDNTIRSPIEMAIKFNDGWTTDLVGSYLEVYSPELDEMVMIRCTEQQHTLTGNRLSTIMRGFRI